METSPFLPLPEGMVIGRVEITAAQLTVEVISTQPFAHGPGCGSPSDHIHCQYQRTVHDVPCGGRRVVLRLCVRKFFRLKRSCPGSKVTQKLKSSAAIGPVPMRMR
jgi:transposase